MFRSSLGLLSPIKEERLKEGAAEEDYDEEEEASTVEEGDDDRSAEEEDDEEQLLSADALRGRMRAAAANGRFQMLPVRGDAVPLSCASARHAACWGGRVGRARSHRLFD